MNAPAGRPALTLLPVELDVLVEAVADRVVERLTEKVGARPALLDRRGLARELGVGVDTVDRVRREGAPEVAVGDSPRFELDRVLEWLRERKP